VFYPLLTFPICILSSYPIDNPHWISFSVGFQNIFIPSDLNILFNEMLMIHSGFNALIFIHQLNVLQTEILCTFILFTNVQFVDGHENRTFKLTGIFEN
jgi:hypothetical protein